MVCLANEVLVKATIRDTIGLGQKRQSTILLSSSKPVNSIFEEVASDFHYDVDAIQLTVQTLEYTIDLSEHKNSSLSDTGLPLQDPSERVNIIITLLKNRKDNIISMAAPATTTTTETPNSEDDLLLGASASPTATGEGSGVKMRLEQLDFNYDAMEDGDNEAPVLDVPNNYVGLVNQAMTCYLNSLLQALYMTPEFRNALYNWEFDGVNETRSIPFQLQKLFLNLQTSHRMAVETTDLTKSFGWQGSEAWQQHDIQELCRVMFDALEQKFKDTKQANLINDLYEGKMLDYVRCLECGTEKSREDTFLDIPLPVRPYGSAVSYNSVEEALRAFVQPETLDDTNQYHCEKCNKKCDAHKGLKFTKFPYLLTLHLKRFDFDYNTMHRIKLNDKVSFPEILNLNAFVTNQKEENDSPDDRDAIVKCDDCSTTDSGSALDDESCQGGEGSSTVNGQDLNCQEEDEGIDMTLAPNQQENMKNANQGAKGPYFYELFSIMIHSGSASGGHYYAYIKDFQSRMWYCFNDQNVSAITEEDIKKTYGGGSLRSHYSSAYSPSTNAYMLMYRQIDKERNASPITVETFPPHIKKLLKQMKAKEEEERLIKEKENDMVKTKIHCYHPVQKQLVEATLMLLIEDELRATVKDCLQRFDLENIVAPDDARLVSYNRLQDTIICSFDNDLTRICDVTSRFNICNSDFLLEIKQPGTEWKEYKPGGVNMKVYTVNLETEEVDGPVNVRVNAGETVGEFKETLANMFNMSADTMKMVQETYSNEPKYLDEDEIPMKFDPNCTGYKIYVSNALDEDPDKSFLLSKLHKIIDRFVHVVSLTVVLPDIDSITLESMSIPPLDLNQNIDIVTDNKTESATTTSSSNLSPRASPQPVVVSSSVEGFGDQSNSEDSSLSDNDRTLVGDAPGDCLALFSSSSDSPADQHMASPSDPTEDTYNQDVLGNPAEEMNWDDTEVPEPVQRTPVNYYFRAVHSPKSGQTVMIEADGTRCCKVMVDKRMNLARFKKCIEPIVGVPMEYFKIYRQYPNQDEEWSRLNDTLSSTKDGERLLVKLGRVLRNDEFIAKIYNLTPNSENGELFTFLFEHIIAKGQTVGQAKKEIIYQAKKQHMLDIPYAKSRLRKKSWKNPAKVFLDDQKFGDLVNVPASAEFFIQQLPDTEKVTSTNQLVLFLRRWCPSTLTLKPFEEVVLDTTTVEELKKKISEMADIEEQYVEVACTKATFPCDMHVLNIQSELEWNRNITHLDNWPWQIYDDGSVLFYRDSREPLKYLTPEERKEINQRESNRLGLSTSKNYPLSGRERALKIYIDNSPSKSDDAD